MRFIKTFLKYKSLLKELVMRDIKIKYRRSVLGFLWSLLNPLLMMLVVSAVFSTIFKFDIPNFPMYLLCGQIIFNFYSEATNSSMLSILDSSSLIKKVYIPKYIFPLSRTLSAFVNLMFALTAIIIMFFITNTPIKPTILLFPIPLLYVLVFSIGIGMILSVLAVFFRDTIHLYGVGLTTLMYFTPIFYPPKLLTESNYYAVRIVAEFNPLYHFIQYFRCIVLYGTVPSLKENIICFGFGIISLVIGMIVFYRNQHKFILYI